MSYLISLGNAVMPQSCAAKNSADSVERELLVSISAGSRSAMARLYFLYFPRLAQFFLQVMGNAALVQELISDTMLEVWRENATVGPNTRVSVWTMGIAYRHARRRLADGGSLPLHDYPRRLTVEGRAALHLAYVGDHSRQDIASIMNMSCESLDAHLSNARRWLRTPANDGD